MLYDLDVIHFVWSSHFEQYLIVFSAEEKKHDVHIEYI